MHAFARLQCRRHLTSAGTYNLKIRSYLRQKKAELSNQVSQNMQLLSQSEVMQIY